MSTYDQGDMPFARGATYFGSGTPTATDGAHLEGRKFRCKDTASGREIVLQIVRNSHGAALTAKRMVSYVAGSTYGRAIDGYTRTTAQDRAGVIDHAYGSKSIAANDLFYIIVEGYAEVLTGLGADANNLLPAGTIICALTAVTSGSTTAGRPAPQDLTGATALLGDQIQNAWGRVLTAATTANTNTAIAVELGRPLV